MKMFSLFSFISEEIPILKRSLSPDEDPKKRLISINDTDQLIQKFAIFAKYAQQSYCLNDTSGNLGWFDEPLYAHAFASTKTKEVIVMLRAKEMDFYNWRSRRAGWGLFGLNQLIDHTFDVYAVLTALTLRKKHLNLDVQVYTFGQPRFTNPVLAIYINNALPGRIFRITHTDDYVPQFSRKDSSQVLLHMYWHHEREFWISYNCDCSNVNENMDKPIGMESDEDLSSMYQVYECVGKIVTGSDLVGVIDENPETKQASNSLKLPPILVLILADLWVNVQTSEVNLIQE
ncbi:hypothetical protein G9A89_012521 [Geosiphon pyriformis]|nr:hypothetical protein G9A89_012521 [Geosiphon pyriformis]